MYRLTLALTLALALLAAPVGAAERTGSRALAVVSGTSAGEEVQLYAQDTKDGGLCLDITVGATTNTDALCGRPSTGPRFDLRPRVLAMGSSTIVYGAVSPRTAVLELTLWSGRPVRLQTSRGRDYDGRHDVRFYAYALRSRAVIAATRALDANGRGLAAADLNKLALPPLNGRVNLRRLPDELRKPSFLVASDTRLLSPTAARPDRRRRGVCVGLRQVGLPPVAGRAVCTTLPRRLDIQFSTDCTTHRSIFYGFAPGAVRRARAILTDGSSRRVTLLRMPRQLHRTTRAMLLVLQGGATVDRIEGLGSNGEPLATIRLDGGGC
jgi:hypothetical protein